MDEESSFEARAVLAPRRARLNRFVLLVPLIALVAISAAGLSGRHSDQATAVAPGSGAADAATTLAVPSPTFDIPAPVAAPAQVVGMDVQRLDEVQAEKLGRDDVVAIKGWYVATAISDCPQLAALYEASAPPAPNADTDALAYCQRSGVLFASPPDVQDSWSGSAGLGAVNATLAIGVVVPPELETIGTNATEVVVLGRFVEAVPGCRGGSFCTRELLVDHVAWTPGA